MNVIRLVEMQSVPSSVACGIIMLKQSDVGIILKQWDNVPRKHFISVALGIQIPSIAMRLVRKPSAMPAQTKTEPQSQKRSRSITQQLA